MKNALYKFLTYYYYYYYYSLKLLNTYVKYSLRQKTKQQQQQKNNSIFEVISSTVWIISTFLRCFWLPGFISYSLQNVRDAVSDNVFLIISQRSMPPGPPRDSRLWRSLGPCPRCPPAKNPAYLIIITKEPITRDLNKTRRIAAFIMAFAGN